MTVDRLLKVGVLVILGSCSSSPEGGRAPTGPRAPKAPAETAAANLPPSDAGLGKTMPPDPRYFAPADAPDPLACHGDKDCIADTIVDPAAGCCVIEGDPMPQTWAWHAWVAEHRMSGACSAMKCKPVAVPETLPRACLLEARCNDYRCGNTCGAQGGDGGSR